MPSHRVFVSYSWDSEDHKRRVLALVQWLRARGIDAWLDTFETSPEEGWPLWCYRQIEKAEHVLAVCTERYEQRVLREQTPDTGRGATWEGGVITSAIYDDVGGTDKFIPVVFSAHDAREYVPFFLRGWSIYDVGQDAGRDQLYRHLTDQPAVNPEPLGPILRLPAAELEMPRPVGDPIVAPRSPPPPANLGDVIEGTWITNVTSPMGQTVTRTMLSRLSGFEGVGIIGAPGWQARGQWQILPPGNRLLLAGTQTSMPFGMQPLRDVFEFHTVTATLLEGMSLQGAMPTRWTRE